MQAVISFDLSALHMYKISVFIKILDCFGQKAETFNARSCRFYLFCVNINIYIYNINAIHRSDRETTSHTTQDKHWNIFALNHKQSSFSFCVD